MMVRVAAACLAVLIAASPARAAWMEATTTHFRLIADATPASMERYATRLERLDQLLRLLYKAPDQPGDASNPLTVYAVRSDGVLQRLYGGRRDGLRGFYRASFAKSKAYVLQRSPAGPWDTDAATLLNYEYAGHFLGRNHAANYPLWFLSGFSEFVGATEFTGKDDDVIYGKPPKYRMDGLLNGKRLRLREVLAPPAKLDPEEGAAISSQGWLLVHYLTFEPSRMGQMNRYLALVNDGVPSLSAAEQVFGDLDVLEKELNRYLGSPLHYMPIPAASLPVGKVILRSLTQGEAAMISVRMKTDVGVSKKDVAELAAEARRLAEPFPDDPDAQISLANAEYEAGNDDAAEAAADRALAARPQFVDALISKGRIRLHRLSEAKASDIAQWREARSWLIRANHEDSDRASPLLFYYQSFHQAGETPPSSAVAGLYRAFELVPQDGNLRMQAVVQYLRDGKPKEARALLLPMISLMRGSAWGTERVASLLALIDAGKTDPASLSAWEKSGGAGGVSVEDNDSKTGG